MSSLSRLDKLGTANNFAVMKKKNAFMPSCSPAVCFLDLLTFLNKQSSLVRGGR